MAANTFDDNASSLENLASEISEGKKTLMPSSSFSFQQLDNFWLEKEDEVEEEEVCCQSYKT